MEAHSKRWIPGLLQAISERSGGGLFAIMRRNSAASELSNSTPERGSDAGFGEVPDATRGYGVQEYEKMWHALSKEQTWPSIQRFSIIGPAGEDFLGTVNQTVEETLGPPEKVSVVPKQRWQSVRLDVKCKSPDDFCLLHHRLKALPNARFLL